MASASEADVENPKPRVPTIRSLPSKATKFNPGKSLQELIPLESILDLIDLPEKEEVTKVGFEEMLTIAKTEEFLKNLLSSVKSLIELKLKFYKTHMETMTENLKNTEAMVKTLTSKGASPQEIERLCPGHTTQHSTLALAREAVSVLVARKNQLSLDSLAKGIEKAFLDSKLGLASLKGRMEIKDFLSNKLYAFSRNHKILGTTFKNVALYGPPGSGKTRSSQVIAWFFYWCYITEKKSPKKVTRADLVAGYTGQTAPRVRGVFFEALGGILFIDEAYELGKGKYGKEGLAELVNLMEDFRGIGLCVAAGYKEPMMKKFMAKNEGMHRRFPHQFTLGPYSSEELSQIFLEELKGVILETDEVSEDDCNLVYTLISEILTNEPEAFGGQAGDATEMAIEVASKASAGGGWSELSLGQKVSVISSSLEELVEKKMDREIYV